MATTKWFLTNVEDGDVITFEGSPHEVPGMKSFYLKRGGKEERIFEYQGQRYTGEVRMVTQYDDVPCNSARCLKAKSKMSECKCQCAGKHHGDFWKLDLDVVS